MDTDSIQSESLTTVDLSSRKISAVSLDDSILNNLDTKSNLSLKKAKFNLENESTFDANIKSFLSDIEDEKLFRKIFLNARGIRYEIFLKHLDKLPNSRLAKLKNCLETNSDLNDLNNLCDDYNLDKNEFYFNKDPYVLNSILSFYTKLEESSKIHFNLNSTNLCIFQLEEEFNYWNIDYEDLIEPCCLLKIHKEKEHISEELRKEEVIIKKLNFRPNFGTRYFPLIRKRVWYLFTNPTSSIYAKLIQILTASLILYSTILFVFGSLPKFQNEFNQISNHTNMTKNNQNIKNTSKENIELAFFISAILSSIWFTIDFLARFISTPFEKLKFFIKLLNIIDLICNIALYIELGFYFAKKLENFIYILRFVQVLRIFRLARHSTGIRSLGYTFSKSRRELILLTLLWSICLLIFSSLAYFAEKDQPQTVFVSIPSALWWAMITMTSVGYGDMLPDTTIGKIIAGMCAVLGLMIIAIPTAVISTNFSDFYANKTKIEKIKRRNDKMRKKEKLKKMDLRIDALNNNSNNYNNNNNKALNQNQLVFSDKLANFFKRVLLKNDSKHKNTDINKILF